MMKYAADLAVMYRQPRRQAGNSDVGLWASRNVGAVLITTFVPLTAPFCCPFSLLSSEIYCLIKVTTDLYIYGLTSIQCFIMAESGQTDQYLICSSPRMV